MLSRSEKAEDDTAKRGEDVTLGNEALVASSSGSGAASLPLWLLMQELSNMRLGSPAK